MNGGEEKYAKSVAETALAEENLRFRTLSLNSLPNAEIDCVDLVAGDKNVLTDRSGKFDARRCRLLEEGETSREVREKLIAAIGELESLPC